MRKMILRSSEWYRAGVPGFARESSGLVVLGGDETRYCCLGVCAVQVFGIHESVAKVASAPAALLAHLVDESEREAVRPYTELWVLAPTEHDEPWERGENNNDALQAMLINDAVQYGELHDDGRFVFPEWVREHSRRDVITDDERVKLLRPIFERRGIELDWRPEE